MVGPSIDSFGVSCAHHGIAKIVGALASLGSVSDSYDNALAESTIGQIKTFPPDTVTAWVHAAYRRHLGLRPFRARPRRDWTWPD